jgi:hypothetical protein
MNSLMDKKEDKTMDKQPMNQDMSKWMNVTKTSKLKT